MCIRIPQAKARHNCLTKMWVENVKYISHHECKCSFSLPWWRVSYLGIPIARCRRWRHHQGVNNWPGDFAVFIRLFLHCFEPEAVPALAAPTPAVSLAAYSAATPSPALVSAQNMSEKVWNVSKGLKSLQKFLKSEKSMRVLRSPLQISEVS